jgi:hypothetical protein
MKKKGLVYAPGYDDRLTFGQDNKTVLTWKKARELGCGDPSPVKVLRENSGIAGDTESFTRLLQIVSRRVVWCP